MAETLSGALPYTGDRSPGEASDGQKSLKVRLWIFIPLWLAFSIASGVLAFYDYRLDDRIAGWSPTLRLPALAESIARDALRIAEGDTAGLEALRKDVDAFSSVIAVLDQGGNLGGQWVAPVSDDLRPALVQVLASWKNTEKDARLLLQNRNDLEKSSQLLASLRPVGEHLARTARAEEVRKQEDINLWLGDFAVRQWLQELSAAGPGLAVARQAADRIQANGAPLSRHAESLAGRLAEARGALKTHRPITLLLSGLATAALLLAAAAYLAAGRRRAAWLDRQNRQNQDAIMRLMDELAVIAEGDLTQRAQVTEDITGAIADSLNFTVEEIHALVLRINEAAEQLNAASRQGREAAEKLRLASEKQSRDVRAATASIGETAESVAQVADSAEAIFKVAGQSLHAAEQGAEAVQKTIASMNVIRDSIQETSKRTKRLGESSQEIGEIVGLISGIAEQTNVLALNAAIQAATAGEAGRGFAIVAEEVQRLAERSAEATQQISALVNAIQNDAKGTVAAMEKSIREVVEGAQLSDGAGDKLAEIQRVSRELAELIAGVTQATKQQENSAVQLTRRMDDIFQITHLTGEETRETSASMQRLADLADTLHRAVSGFKV
jgi:methyl-accepting chemotaxis protein